MSLGLCSSILFLERFFRNLDCKIQVFPNSVCVCCIINVYKKQYAVLIQHVLFQLLVLLVVTFVVGSYQQRLILFHPELSQAIFHFTWHTYLACLFFLQNLSNLFCKILLKSFPRHDETARFFIRLVQGGQHIKFPIWGL